MCVHSFSLFTFFSPPAASEVPTLLPASCPGTWDPVASDCAESLIASLISEEIAGGGPDTGPVSFPTSNNVSPDILEGCQVRSVY